MTIMMRVKVATDDDVILIHYHTNATLL
jgi:hypothetical protein